MLRDHKSAVNAQNLPGYERRVDQKRHCLRDILRRSQPLDRRLLAQAFQNKQEYDKAIKYLTEALAVETDNVEKEKLLVRIGVVQLATKNYAEARKAALEAQALNPEDGMTYFVLAQCYGAQASGANFTSQAMYWVAYDTMEKAAQLLEEADLKETATKMMAAFRSAWPSKEECFFNEVQAGQRYVVNGIATTVRCIR